MAADGFRDSTMVFGAIYGNVALLYISQIWTHLSSGRNSKGIFRNLLFSLLFITCISCIFVAVIA